MSITGTYANQIKVDGENWYVGQGRVALYYVDSYTLEAHMIGDDKALQYVKRIQFEPEAINNEEVHTSSFGFNIGGSLGFSGGKASGDIQALGSVGLTGGITVNDEVAVTVRDCNCTAYTGGANPTSIKWIYDFKNPHGKFQKIEGVPDLAHSTFSPVDYWVWRIPTKYRQKFKSFMTSVQVNVASIITRYSGSQPAKIINSKPESVDFSVDLPYPPLLCTEVQFVQVDKAGGTKQIPLMTEYKDLRIEIRDIESGEACDWVEVKQLHSHTEHSVLEITIDSMDLQGEDNPSRNCEIIVSGNNQGQLLSYQKNEEDIESIQIIVSQFKKMA